MRAAIVLVAACSVGPTYHVPSAPVPMTARYKEGGWQIATPADALRRGAWWKVFREPELDALEARVTVDNQTIAASLASYFAARAQIQAAQAQYFPTVSAAPSVNISHPRGGTRTTAYALPLEASWAPDLFGRVRNTVHSAQYGAQASAADLENQKLIEQATLAQAYFQIRGEDALVDILDRTVEADTQILELTRSQFELGITDEVAVVQAEQALQLARVQLTNAGLVRAQLEHAIATLIGVPATSFSLPNRALLPAPPRIPTGAPSRLLERRPDIAGAERQMARANAAIGIATAAYYPSLTLSANAGFASSALSTLVSWPSRVWGIGAALAETLFDAGARGAQVRAAVASYDVAVATYRQTVLNAFQQVEDALAGTAILAREVDEQNRAVALAQRALELERGRVETGIDPYIDLMTQQTLLLSAQQTQVQLRVQQMTTAVQLVEALGGGWDRADLPSPGEASKPPT